MMHAGLSYSVQTALRSKSSRGISGKFLPPFRLRVGKYLLEVGMALAELETGVFFTGNRWNVLGDS